MKDELWEDNSQSKQFQVNSDYAKAANMMNIKFKTFNENIKDEFKLAINDYKTDKENNNYNYNDNENPTFNKYIYDSDHVYRSLDKINLDRPDSRKYNTERYDNSNMFKNQIKFTSLCESINNKKIKKVGSRIPKNEMITKKSKIIEISSKLKYNTTNISNNMTTQHNELDRIDENDETDLNEEYNKTERSINIPKQKNEIIPIEKTSPEKHFENILINNSNEVNLSKECLELLKTMNSSQIAKIENFVNMQKILEETSNISESVNTNNSNIRLKVQNGGDHAYSKNELNDVVNNLNYKINYSKQSSQDSNLNPNENRNIEMKKKNLGSESKFLLNYCQ